LISFIGGPSIIETSADVGMTFNDSKVNLCRGSSHDIMAPTCTSRL
jgi:hypothetical protein